MKYKYKNIKLKVETINPNFVCMKGEGSLYIPIELFTELIENSCTFFEFIKYEYEELFDELDDDVEKINTHFLNMEESEICVSNSDAIIAVYEYCLDDSETEYELNVETENISWVIHDMLHARHDAAGCTIYVEADIEKERIIESLRITAELFPNEIPGFNWLEELEDEFYGRFKVRLDLEEFKYIGYDYEYEY